ncbi:cobyric acid synthase CobQ [Pseudothermotoga thermarum]|uniref:CobQ/CobB/MinD/ParA nucleotide binding domain-containing protein n=1 Tax=Pseudothermotoga thermarum DSM 5069 TaxID=688269 RepID=F7YWA7_9THEM|nr:cobyric acid synthase CobQ [Pseudothermotoga thermarum]AEH51882.1 hypothetical protein Theth_1840 [Pseudothermotoga thermarum DSM 5069]
MGKNYIFIGLYGSGKTEVAINFALKLKELYENVAIVDLDVVSPYFRVRDVKERLQQRGLTVITPPEAVMRADVPLIATAVSGYLENPKYKVVLDVGGEKGTIVLGSLRNKLVGATTYLVVNTRRPFSQTVEEVVKTAQDLEALSGVKIDYLINNTNLGEKTTPQIIEEGENVLQEASKLLDKPVAYTVVADCLQFNGKFAVFRIERFLKDKEVKA